MKKLKIVGIVVIALLLMGLIIFASTHKYEDSHLRVDGIRVRLNDGALVVADCDEQNAIMCKKTIKVGDEEAKLEFKFVDFKENGYPDGLVATINGNVFYETDGLNIEEVGSIDYKIFLNFYVMDDKYIMYTFTDGTNGKSTTLYGMDLEGNIILEEYEIDDDEMLIKDYTDFITYDENKIKIYASRVIEDINYHGKSICYADKDRVVEAYYTYTYKNGKFSKKQTDTITAAKFIEDKGIICANED